MASLKPPSGSPTTGNSYGAAEWGLPRAGPRRRQAGFPEEADYAHLILELRDIRVEVHAIDPLDLQRHVGKPVLFDTARTLT